MEKQPANTWIRPKSTGMEIEDDNDLDSVFREVPAEKYVTLPPLPDPQEAYAEVMKHVESIYPKENKMPGQSIISITPEEVAENLKNMIEIETVNTVTPPAPEKKTRTRAPKATTGKTATPEEMIALMEAKIEALRSISKLEWTGGTGNSDTPKAIREVLIGIASDVETLKAKYTEIISAI